MQQWQDRAIAQTSTNKKYKQVRQIPPDEVRKTEHIVELNWEMSRSIFETLESVWCWESENGLYPVLFKFYKICTFGEKIGQQQYGIQFGGGYLVQGEGEGDGDLSQRTVAVQAAGSAWVS